QIRNTCVTCHVPRDPNSPTLDHSSIQPKIAACRNCHSDARNAASVEDWDYLKNRQATVTQLLIQLGGAAAAGGPDFNAGGGLLDLEEGRMLTESEILFLGNGQMWFAWGQRSEGAPERAVAGLSWLPEGVYNRVGAISFSQSLSVWRDRKEWILAQHAADARCAAERSHLTFRIALTLSPEQLAWMIEQDGLPVSMLRPEQRTLLEAAISL